MNNLSLISFVSCGFRVLIVLGSIVYIELSRPSISIFMLDSVVVSMFFIFRSNVFSMFFVKKISLSAWISIWFWVVGSSVVVFVVPPPPPPPPPPVVVAQIPQSVGQVEQLSVPLQTASPQLEVSVVENVVYAPAFSVPEYVPRNVILTCPM